METGVPTDPNQPNLEGFGVVFAFQAPPSVLGDVRSALADRTALRSTSADPVITYEIRTEDELIVLRHDEVELAHVGFAADAVEAADVIGDDVHQQIAHRSEQYLLIHAGAVAWNGLAIVIPGRSHSGKSTLTAALVRAGAEYLSDEFAVLDAEGLVHPYPRKLSIRDGNSEGTPTDVAELGGRAADGPRPLALVVSTRHEPGASWEPTELAGSRGLLPLIDNSVVAQTRSEHTLSTIARLGDRVITLIGLRGEADAAAADIIALVERPGALRVSSERRR